MEINLPPSGLAKVAFSDFLPNPPVSDHQKTQAFSSLASPVSEASHTEVERIWSYYLSEIAVRKIGNRIMNCFYQEDATAWLSMPLHRMIRVAEELELQLSQWYDCLSFLFWFSSLPQPSQALFSHDTYETQDMLSIPRYENIPVILFTPSTTNSASPSPPGVAADSPSSTSPHHRVASELHFMLHARLADFRERIYRPFLYLAMHLPRTDPAQQTLTPYVQRCVSACLSFLNRGTPRHRHHGTWFENRGMVLKTLLLLAAARSGAVGLPGGWEEGVERCLAGLRFWEGEAPDLGVAREILSELLGSL